MKSHYFNLHVLVPTAFILGNDEYHTQAGNAISLVCIIENVTFYSLEEFCLEAKRSSFSVMLDKTLEWKQNFYHN